MNAQLYNPSPSSTASGKSQLFSCTDVIDYAFNSVTAQLFVIHSDCISLYDTKKTSAFTKSATNNSRKQTEAEEYDKSLSNIRTEEKPTFSSTAEKICPTAVWTFDYIEHFTAELYGISWTTEFALVEAVESINSWVCLFNRRYLKLIHNKRYYSRFIDLEKSNLSMRYLPMSNMIMLEGANKKSFTTAFLEIDSFFENKRQNTKDIILYNQPSFGSSDQSEPANLPLLFSIKPSPKTLLHRHKVATYQPCEHLRRLFVVFETGHLKSYKLPSWEQVASLAFEATLEGANTATLSIHQEWVLVSLMNTALLVDAFSLSIIYQLDWSECRFSSLGQVQARVVLSSKLKTWFVLVSESGDAATVEVPIVKNKSQDRKVSDEELCPLQRNNHILTRSTIAKGAGTVSKLRTEILVDAGNTHHICILQAARKFLTTDPDRGRTFFFTSSHPSLWQAPHPTRQQPASCRLLLTQKLDVSLFTKHTDSPLPCAQLQETLPALKESLSAVLRTKSAQEIDILLCNDHAQILVIGSADSVLVVSQFQDPKIAEVQKNFLQASKIGSPKACAELHPIGVAVVLYCRSSLDYVVCNFKFNKPSYTNFSSYVGSRIVDVRLFEDFLIVVTEDAVIHVKSAKDLTTRNEVSLQLQKVTSAFFRNPLALVTGDIVGKIELMNLSRENLDCLTYKHYEFHNSAVVYLHTEEKEKDNEPGFWIVSCAGNVFALWDSEMNIRPLISVFLDMKIRDQIRAVDVHQKSQRLVIKFTRGYDIYSSDPDFWMPDLSMVYKQDLQPAIHHLMEKRWRCMQHLEKIAPNLTSIDQNHIAEVTKVLQTDNKDTKDSTVCCRFTQLLYPYQYFQTSNQYHKMALVVYLTSILLRKSSSSVMKYNSTNVKYLEKHIQHKSGGSDLHLRTPDFIYNKTEKLLRAGQQTVTMYQNESWSLFQNDQIPLETRLKAEIKTLIDDLTDLIIDTKTKQLLQSQNRQKLVQAVAAPLDILRSIFEKKSEMTRKMHTYYQAAEIGTLKYDLPLEDRSLYSLEKEIAFVKKRTDYEFELDSKYYQVAKDLWKKKNWRRLKEPLILKANSSSGNPSHSRSSERNNSIVEYSSDWQKTPAKQKDFFPTAVPTYYEEVEPTDQKTPAFQMRKLGLHGANGLLPPRVPSAYSRRASGVTFGVATPLLARKESNMNVTTDSWAASPRNRKLAQFNSPATGQFSLVTGNPQILTSNSPRAANPLLLTPPKHQNPTKNTQKSPPAAPSAHPQLKSFRLSHKGLLTYRSSSQETYLSKPAKSPEITDKHDKQTHRQSPNNHFESLKWKHTNEPRKDTKWADCLKSAAKKTKRLESMFFCPDLQR